MLVGCKAHRLLLAAPLTVALALACASPHAAQTDGDTYIRWAVFPVPIHEFVVLRWPKRTMPLRIYLPRPPPGMFRGPDAIYAAVRKGVLAWTGVAGPELPSFVFVDAEGHADIQATVMHDMGHALGIGGHSPDPGDIMYKTTVGKTSPRLSGRDRATMKLLYSLPIGQRIVGAQREHAP